MVIFIRIVAVKTMKVDRSGAENKIIQIRNADVGLHQFLSFSIIFVRSLVASSEDNLTPFHELAAVQRVFSFAFQQCLFFEHNFANLILIW